MPTYRIYAGGASPYSFDLGTFELHIRKRWPEVVLTAVPPITESKADEFYFRLPRYPLIPFLDSSAQDGIRWLPRAKLVSDPSASGGRRWVAELDDGSIDCQFFPSLGSLNFTGGGMLDLAAIAVWIRSWIPQSVRIVAGIEDMARETEILPNDIVKSMVWKLLQVNQGSSSWRNLQILIASPPPGLFPDAMIKNLVRAALTPSKGIG